MSCKGDKVTTFDGDAYQRRFDALAEQGVHVHGEADFVSAYAEATSVLDAGCGTGRVAIELARRGIDVAGVDARHTMIETARRLAPEIMWVEADMGSVDLARTFDVVVMAGNVPLFTPPGSTAALVAGCARHLRVGGLLVAGFQLDRGYSIEQYDAEAADADLELIERFSTWNRDPFDVSSDYAVSVHRRLGGPSPRS